MVIVSVYDKKAQQFSVPNFVSNVQAAIRSYRMELNRPGIDNPVSAYPDDFALYTLGNFDPDTGKFICPDIPELLLECSLLKE